jgi:hypothetical protein
MHENTFQPPEPLAPDFAARARDLRALLDVRERDVERRDAQHEARLARLLSQLRNGRVGEAMADLEDAIGHGGRG